MKVYGIIGRPLGHSFSKRYFEEKFASLGLDDHCYCNFPLESLDRLPETIAGHPALCGFNVTIPYKKEIIGLLDAVSSEAAEIGAVNCVKIEDGKLTGYNTDAGGFRAGLDELIGGRRPDALVLGTGGASNAVRYELRRMGIGYLTVSRNRTEGAITYAELTPEIVGSHKLIINTTPLGTWPGIEQKPDIPYDGIGPGHFLYDLVYNPPVTAFLAEGRERGAATMNGERMLYAQAEKCWDIWQGR